MKIDALKYKVKPQYENLVDYGWSTSEDSQIQHEFFEYTFKKNLHKKTIYLHSLLGKIINITCWHI